MEGCESWKHFWSFRGKQRCRRMDGWKDGWMDGGMVDGWIDGSVNTISSVSSIYLGLEGLRLQFHVVSSQWCTGFHLFEIDSDFPKDNDIQYSLNREDARCSITIEVPFLTCAPWHSVNSQSDTDFILLCCFARVEMRETMPQLLGRTICKTLGLSPVKARSTCSALWDVLCVGFLVLSCAVEQK